MEIVRDSLHGYWRVGTLTAKERRGLAHVDKMARRQEKYNLTTHHTPKPPQRPLVYDSSRLNCAAPMHTICNQPIVSPSAPKLQPTIVSFLSLEVLRCKWCHFAVILTMHIFCALDGASSYLRWHMDFDRRSLR